MLSQFIWWGGIALEALLLVRGIRGNFAFRYPVFYTYVSFVFLQSLLRLLVYHWDPQLYSRAYWITEWLGVAFGCGVVLEIYRVGLSAYPGTARMARNLLAFLFLMSIAKAFVDTSNNPQWWRIATTAEVERNLRLVQALSLVGLVALFLIYAIPFGKNLRGILLGYGFFIAISVVQLTFVSSEENMFSRFWHYLHPASYDITLGVWAGHLWAYQPVPEPRATVLLEQQYQRVAAATTRRLQDARGYLGRAVRP